MVNPSRFRISSSSVFKIQYFFSPLPFFLICDINLTRNPRVLHFAASAYNTSKTAITLQKESVNHYANGERDMKNFGKKPCSRNKTTAAAIASLLILSMTSALVLLPSSHAYSPPWVIPTSAYVTVTPNPIGVNQRCLIVVYTDRYSPTAGGAVGQVWELPAGYHQT
jgi:hypothetical protein